MCGLGVGVFLGGEPMGEPCGGLMAPGAAAAAVAGLGAGGAAVAGLGGETPIALGGGDVGEKVTGGALAGRCGGTETPCCVVAIGGAFGT
jgi:hypothetical protein